MNDVSAVLSGGHAANGAYWFDTQNGNMISSSYYVDIFPEWVRQFNEKQFAKMYTQRNWTTLLPVNSYQESQPDDYILEKGYYGFLQLIKNKGKLQYGIYQNIYSDTYNPNDLGYLQRNNQLTTESYIYYQKIEPSWIIREYNGNLWWGRPAAAPRAGRPSARGPRARRRRRLRD